MSAGGARYDYGRDGYDSHCGRGRCCGWRRFGKLALALALTGALFALVAAMPGARPAHAAEQPAAALQPLLDRALPGDTLVLPPGVYTGPATIDKPLTVRVQAGGEAAVLAHADADAALTIAADDVTVEGLRIVDETVKDAPTVLVAGDRAQLLDLRISSAGKHAITVRDANDGTVARSTIAWAAEGVRMASKGNGIDLYNAHRWIIADNMIADMHDGIYMENSDDALVEGNAIERSRYGVHCMYTRGTIIRGNTSERNVTGAMVMTAQGVTVADNTFVKQNENVHSQGILLFDAHESVIADNVVEGNRVGLYVEQSTGNRLERNRVRYNFIGLQLLDADDNTAQGNAFIGNVTDAQARGSAENRIAGNYWDSFQGIDTNGDGTSDIAYAINPFFSELVQKRPAFQLFFQSPGIRLLEELHRTDRLQWAADEAPLMSAPAGLDPGDVGHGESLVGAIGLALLGGSGLLMYVTRRRTI